MSVYNHRSMIPAGHNRLLQILEALRAEFDQLTQEAMISRMNTQIQEMTMLQQHLIELERAQQGIRKQYEDEISQLRMQLEQVSSVPGGHIRKRSGGYAPAPPPMMDHAAYPPPLQLAAPPTQGIATQPTSGPSSAANMPHLADIDPDTVPTSMKIEGHGWFALFSPKVVRSLKIELIHTFDHDSVVCCVAFSPDGRYFAAGCNRTTHIYDILAGSPIAVLQDATAERDGDLYIRSISFSPDGKYLATGAEDKQIRIWDIAKKSVRRVMEGHEQDIYSLEFSSDGHILVSGSGDHTMMIWDWTTGQCLHKLQIRKEDEKEPGVTSVAVSPNGRFVAAGSLDKVVRIWDVATGRLLERLEGHEDSVYSVAFMPDGKSLVSGSLDKTLRMWRLGGGNACTRVFSGHKDFVLSVATTSDGRWIVSGSKDRSIQFWDPHTGQAQFMLQGHGNSVIAVATNPGRKPLFATGSGDFRARVWGYNTIPA